MPSFGSTTFQAAQPGMTRLAMALGGAGGRQGAYGDAYDQELQLQSRLAQSLAAARAHDASADLSGAKAEAERAQTAMQTPEALLRGAMTSQGVPLNEVQAVSQYRDTGRLGGAYAPAADGMGPVAPEPEWASKLPAVLQQLSGVQRALTIGDKNSENIAKAASIERGMRLGDAVMAGTADRNRVAGAQAAIEGKPMYHAGADGGVLDLFAGALDASNPMAQSTIGLRGAQASNQQAAARAHDAQAGAARALADQRRQVTANGPGPGKVPTGYRYTTGPDGEARLEPIPGGPKDPNAQTGKPLPASAAKGHLENLAALRQVDTALKLISGENVGDMKGDANATGMKGYLPNSILARTDPAGVSTRALIADIGSLKLHDRSGAAVTAAETPRLLPFIPQVNDPPAVVKKKLEQFRQNYQAIVDESEDFYKQSGYNVPVLKPRSSAPAAGGAPSGWSITPE